MENNVAVLFKCLADQSRLQILQSLGREDMYVERLAERLGLSPPTISFHLKKLETVNAVKARKEQYYTVYSLNRDILSRNILDFILTGAPYDSIQDRRDELYRQKVLSTFIEQGKLKSIPAQLKKRKIILEEISKAFDAGKAYAEREVNIILADYCDDFCTIRRDMIGAGLLQRENGIYTKISDHAT